MMTRRTLVEYQLGGYTLPAGTFLILSPYVTHHDPRFFPDPEVFDPERWVAPVDTNQPKFAYFPFGGGPRQCLGEGFAWMEGMLLLATLAQQWQMRLVPGHPVVPPLGDAAPQVWDAYDTHPSAWGTSPARQINGGQSGEPKANAPAPCTAGSDGTACHATLFSALYHRPLEYW